MWEQREPLSCLWLKILFDCRFSLGSGLRLPGHVLNLARNVGP